MKKIIFLLSAVTAILACNTINVDLGSSPIANNNDLSYQYTVEPIIESYCIACHSGKSPAAGLNLTAYDAIVNKIENGNLLHRINDAKNPMPPGGLMPTEVRQVISEWSNNGYTRIDQPRDSEIENLTEKNDSIISSSVDPINIDVEGFEFFNLMQGHWVGDIFILNERFNWFAFDYRPISASHIHGIYEGGTLGNLFTSFFIAEFNNTKTIMARNGGVLNGIYRTSYFVLDKVELSKNRKYFRFVDAYGGKEIMWMELEFIQDKLNFNSYTSRFGQLAEPTTHMKFNARRKHVEISKTVADFLKYPKNTTAVDFSYGLPMPNWGEEYPTITSASYIHRDEGQDLSTLALLSGDPYTLEDMPYLSRLSIEIEQNDLIRNQEKIIYLSMEALTDGQGKMLSEHGYIREDLFDGVLSFPLISPEQTEFTFTYLHPGQYFVTIIADTNKDGYISKGDIMSKSVELTVKPNTSERLTIEGIHNQN